MGRLYERIHYRLYGRWMQVTNFSNQDRSVAERQRFDTPEFLSATDAYNVVLRRLFLQARGMMKPEEAKRIADTRAEEVSFQLQHEAGKEPERISSML